MSKSQSGKNNPSYGKFGDNSLHAIKVINLDTLTVYGSMISCAESEYNNKKAMKLISKAASLTNNRLSYMGNHYAKIDNSNNIYIKIKVAELLNLNIDLYKANGKSYIIVPLNKLSKKA